ncbi:septum formation initiator family protein [Loktanella salsilacus]|jgi:cell division protein FtsB|uniref:Cell division protein FtsB n=1 Tax=Loktanella salsilacus TaxID=195913 RepID=A0A1I4EFA2_9RHOB|nr:septum formation initiator family protein [Loktanella salsilacus]MBU0782265.1 septum formation initiator family protein [Alphaproteobacteria bacterium]MBU0860672.1 septum formation initiator family protein [Alphaproteobacteria bacterium]MBU1835219.1 septum formation initiator family protein [Alphaproteobacteria bacterium]UTH43172.1 septum formation initiator family protein [Loktanella salsilacus]UTH46877.1 septum formation initiator family protein [Loktanella salsilacus]|tara:strand:- start:1469 stop:1768 length:300 start_codon:yes stop_codon:yes gene_type:complete
MNESSRPGLGTLIYFLLTLMLGLYFTFAAIQGDYGIFKRAEVDAEAQALEIELAALQIELDGMENLTKRLSDDFLDLDLLDEQARDVLGMVRTDEIVIQ